MPKFACAKTSRLITFWIRSARSAEVDVGDCACSEGSFAARANRERCQNKAGLALRIQRTASSETCLVTAQLRQFVVARPWLAPKSSNLMFRIGYSCQSL